MPKFLGAPQDCVFETPLRAAAKPAAAHAWDRAHGHTPAAVLLSRGDAVIMGECCAELADAVSGSPLGPVVSAFGVKLSGGEGGVTVDGPMAAVVRRAAYWYRQPTNEQKLRVGASWVTAGLQELQRAMPSSARTESGGRETAAAGESAATAAAGKTAQEAPAGGGGGVGGNGSVGQTKGSTADV